MPAKWPGRRIRHTPSDYGTYAYDRGGTPTAYRLPGMAAREGNRLTPAAWLAQRQAKHQVKTAA